jgi:hypothetical protein
LFLQGPGKGSWYNRSCISKEEEGKTACKMLQNTPLGCNDLRREEKRREEKRREAFFIWMI